MPVELVRRPTVREPDGLALSSRNRYLNARGTAGGTGSLSGTRTARHAVAAGEQRAERVRQILRETLESEPMAKLDYAEVANAETLEPLGDLGKDPLAVALLAARIGTTRLIDNAILIGGATICRRPLAMSRSTARLSST